MSKGPAGLESMKTLYDPNDTSQEAQRYRDFLTNHQITYLGGGNSQNFIVLNTTTQRRQVLKLEERLDAPKLPAREAMSEMGHNFAHEHGERAVVVSNSLTGEGQTVRSLTVTDYYPKGSVMSYAHGIDNPKERFEASAAIMQQMAEVYMELEENNFMFTDGKGANWLIDEDGMVHLADTKAIYRVQSPDHVLEYGANTLNEHVEFPAGTTGYIPEQDGSFTEVSARETHEFLLGKVMLDFLYTEEFSSFDRPPEEDQKFYESAEAKQYARIGHDLCYEGYPQNGVSKRLSIKEAHKKLCELQPQEKFDKQFAQFEKEIKALSFDGDPLIQRFLEERKKAYDAASNNQERAFIVKDLVKFKANYPNDLASQSILVCREGLTIDDTDVIGGISSEKISQAYHQLAEKQPIERFNQIFTDVSAKLLAQEFNKDDKVLINYIEQMKQKYDECHTNEERTSVLLEMQQTSNKLDSDPFLHAIQASINELRDPKHKGFKSQGAEEKAQRIEKALNELTVEERKHFSTMVRNNDPKAMKVLNEVNSKRVFKSMNTDNYKITKHDAAPKEETYAFKAFKDALSTKLHQQPANDQHMEAEQQLQKLAQNR
jgi:serine/threonine protein kinase